MNICCCYIVVRMYFIYFFPSFCFMYFYLFIILFFVQFLSVKKKNAHVQNLFYSFEIVHTSSFSLLSFDILSEIVIKNIYIYSPIEFANTDQMSTLRGFPRGHKWKNRDYTIRYLSYCRIRIRS